MAQTNLKTQEQLNKIISSLHKKKENAECFECLEKGTTYIVINLGTFVCAKCAGIIRELNYFVKGIGLSNFKESEIDFLNEMGNENAKKIWLAKFDPIINKFPHPKNLLEIKNHIKEKYIEKKFYYEKESHVQVTNYKIPETKRSNTVKENDNKKKFDQFDTLNEIRSDFINEIKKNEYIPKKIQSTKNAIIYPILGKSNYNTNSNQPSNSNLSNNVLQSKNSCDKTDTLNFSEISVLNNIQINTNQNSQTISKGFNFNNCFQTNDNKTNFFKQYENSINSNDIQYDFTKQLTNFPIIQKINNLYLEKKEDPLDKLLLQHISFNQVNDSQHSILTNINKITLNTNNNNQNNQSKISCMYGYNFLYI